MVMMLSPWFLMMMMMQMIGSVSVHGIHLSVLIIVNHLSFHRNVLLLVVNDVVFWLPFDSTPSLNTLDTRTAQYVQKSHIGGNHSQHNPAEKELQWGIVHLSLQNTQYLRLQSLMLVEGEDVQVLKTGLVFPRVITEGRVYGHAVVVHVCEDLFPTGEQVGEEHGVRIDAPATTALLRERLSV